MKPTTIIQRTLALALALLLVFTLISCNKKPTENISSTGADSLLNSSTINQELSSANPSSGSTENPGKSETSSSKGNTPSSSGGVSQSGTVKTIAISEYAYAGDDNAVLAEAIKSLGLKVASAKIKGENVSYKLMLEKKTYKLSKTIQMNSISNLEIAGNGAKFVWTSIVGGFYMKNCSNLKFSDLTIDYDPMIYTQGTVTSVSGGAVALQVDNGFPDNSDWLFDKSKTVYSIIYDPNTKAPKDGSSHTYSFNNIQRTGPMKLSMSLTFGTRDGVQGPVVGDKLSLFIWAGPSTFFAQDCANTKYVNLTVHQSPGSVINESSGDGGSLIQNVKVIPGPSPAGTDSVRYMSILSDAFHFGNVKNGPIIDNCVVSNCADDGVNVQGFFFHVLQVVGDKKLIVTPKWDTPLTVGETIEGFKNEGYASVGKAKITAFERKNNPSMTSAIKEAYIGMDQTLGDPTLIYEITLDKALNLVKGDHLTSTDRVGSGAVIKNSTFKNNRARGVVVKGQNVLIENNTFERNTSPAIVAHADLYWCESAFPVNVKILNNKISNSAVSGNMIKWADNDMMGSILINVSPPSGVQGFYNSFENKNIVVEGNTITNTQIYGIFATNCDGVTIKNNTIINPLINGAGTLGQLYGITPKSGIFVGMSKNITVTGNAVSGGTVSEAIEIHNTCSGNIINSGNSKQ